MTASASASVHWLDVVVEFARSPAADEKQLTRGERYRARRAAAQRHRQELEAWLEREGLVAEVSAIGEATAFDLLFAKVTPEAAAALQHAPDVVAVTPAGG
jgi:hypothetical protein